MQMFTAQGRGLLLCSRVVFTDLIGSDVSRHARLRLAARPSTELLPITLHNASQTFGSANSGSHFSQSPIPAKCSQGWRRVRSASQLPGPTACWDFSTY
jgi:hypothetical protein